MKDYSNTKDIDWLDVNKLVHDKGVKRFEPAVKIVTFEKGAELFRWCQNRYTNLNGNSIELSDTRAQTYCDTRRFYLDFMSEKAPPSEQCSDYFRLYGDTGFNPRSHKQEFSLFEMVFYIAVELDLQAEFEYSNEFIDRILNFTEKDLVD